MIHHKKSTGYGTVLGGTCSLIVSTGFSMFVIIQILTWLIKPTYNQTIETGFITRKANTAYDVPLNQFLPAYKLYYRNDTQKDPEEIPADLS